MPRVAENEATSPCSSSCSCSSSPPPPPSNVPKSEKATELLLLLVVDVAENQTVRQQEDGAGQLDTQPFSFEIRYSLLHTAIITFIIAILIMFTVFGNSLVLLSILIDRRLQTIPNYLIFSLAISDLLVAIVVMPIALIIEISKHWFLGAMVCDIWICSDVLCCTSSILHLVAIALDRYWSVTNLNYAHARSKRRVIGMIVLIWLISAGISIPPLVGWREPGNDPVQTGVCRISQDPGYTIYSTLGAFYVPLVIMIVMYVRIYIAARRRIRNAGLRRRKAVVNSQIMLVLTEPSITIGTGGHMTPAPPRDLGVYTIESSDRTANSVSDSYAESQLQSQQQQNATRPCRSGGSTTRGTRLSNGDEREREHKSSAHTQPSFSEALEPLRSESVSTHSPSTTPLTGPRRKSVQWDNQHVAHSASAAAAAVRRRKISGLSASSSNVSDPLESQGTFRVLQVNFRRKSRGSLSSTHSQVSTSSSYPLDSNSDNPKRYEKLRSEQKRQSRAIRTVLLITCVFVICWTAFFCHALIAPLCSSCRFPSELVSVFVWLGYSNSFCNFIIYSIFSPEFRRAFRNIFCSSIQNYHESHVRRMAL